MGTTEKEKSGKSTIVKLRLILGDQLNQNHSWFGKVQDNVTYIMAEMRQETDYVTHHIQKVTAFFLAMRTFSKTIRDKGHKVIYLKISDKDNPQRLDQIIRRYIAMTKAKKFEYQLPDEYRQLCIIDTDPSRRGRSLVPGNLH